MNRPHISSSTVSRALARLLVVAMLAPSVIAVAPTVAQAETSAPIVTEPTAATIESATITPSASTSPSMTTGTEMMCTMDMSVDTTAMQLHMELLSAEMKAMMSEMMSSTADASATAGGAHDHAGHGSAVPVHRFGDPSVAQRAVALSRSTHETGTVTAAVLVNLGRPQEAIAAAGLAGAVRGPLLPASINEVSPLVLDELERLGVRRVYVVGPTTQISAAATSGIIERGMALTRVAGTNRYATASAVARKIAAVTGQKTVGTVFVVNSDRPWDALTVSSYAYARKAPVLFVNGLGVPTVTARALTDLHVRRAIVVSTGISIKDSTYRAVASRTSGSDVRLSADTRWALADSIARYALARTWVNASHPVISNGTDYMADALIAGPHAGAKGSVHMLTPPVALPRTARVFFNEFKSSITHTVVVGTSDVVSDDVLIDVGSLIQGMSH